MNKGLGKRTPQSDARLALLWAGMLLLLCLLFVFAHTSPRAANLHYIVTSGGILQENTTGLAPTSSTTTSNFSQNMTIQAAYPIDYFTVPATVQFEIGNETFSITLNFITPTGAGVTINGHSYTLSVGNVTLLAGQTEYFANMTSLGYLPVLHWINLTVFMAVPTQPTTVSTTTTSVSTSSTTSIVLQILPPTNRTASEVITTLNISLGSPAQINFTNADTLVTVSTHSLFGVLANIAITNLTNTPNLPSLTNQQLLVALELNIQSKAAPTLSMLIRYPCGIPANSLAPYEAVNGTWAGITPYSVNQSACTVAFSLEKSAVVALLTNQRSTSKPVELALPEEVAGAAVVVVCIYLAIKCLRRPRWRRPAWRHPKLLRPRWRRPAWRHPKLLRPKWRRPKWRRRRRFAHR